MSRPYAIVTGANKPSIGFRTAQRLAGEPFRFRVILACRNEARGREAQAAIEAADPRASVKYMHLNLANMSSIRSFATAFDALLPHGQGLAVLVNNAGVGFGRDQQRKVTDDGHERIFGTNHLGHFLLTNLLMPALKRAPSARVVVVSSSLHDPGLRRGSSHGRGTTLDLSDLQLERPGAYEVGFAYRVSKLANLLFAYELQRRLRAQGCTSVAVNSLSPGFIPQTNLSREAGVLGRFFLRYILDGLLRRVGLVRFTRSIDDGAEATVRCATDSLATKGGEYFEYTKEGVFRAQPSSVESYDEDKAKALWERSAELVGGVPDL